MSLEWLRSAGLVHLVSQIRSAKLPLAGYADATKFKVFMLDNGLLGAYLNLDANLILEPNQLYSEYNGAFIENYVCNELIRLFGSDLHYWSSDREAEVDFLIQVGNSIIPLEVKSGTNTNMQSLRAYAGKFDAKHLFRFSPRNFTTVGDFTNLPLYALSGFPSLLRE